MGQTSWNADEDDACHDQEDVNQPQLDHEAGKDRNINDKDKVCENIDGRDNMDTLQYDWEVGKKGVGQEILGESETCRVPAVDSEEKGGYQNTDNKESHV